MRIQLVGSAKRAAKQSEITKRIGRNAGNTNIPSDSFHCRLVCSGNRHIHRKDINAICGVVGDLGDGFADHRSIVGIVCVKAQFGAEPDVRYMVQAVLRTVRGGHHNAVDLIK